ncbi:MAG: RnfABCDGE type electron transport complex subunit B [Clostridia bacterium]|jgi:Na+-translocating ferredoxin:NAD+ oxidoreductase RNF subunit RnfB|nr:RnfABCDGE type electron transport complex subunit B [Clostridia bacterium]
MDYHNILSAVLSLTAMGLLFGVILGIASKVFAVHVDPRIQEVADALPGSNCGGCGYPGCANYANAIVTNQAPLNKCMVGGTKAAEAISQIMGRPAPAVVQHVAIVKCSAACDVATQKYQYEGHASCRAAASLSNGPELCPFACCGMGDCVKACQFDAIHLVNGVAVVDKNKCTGCGACAKACPKGIILLREPTCNLEVLCSNHQRGPDVVKACGLGCIACGLCEKNCPNLAIQVVDNLAVIDPEKCVGCGTCVEICPRHTIRSLS